MTPSRSFRMRVESSGDRGWGVTIIQPVGKALTVSAQLGSRQVVTPDGAEWHVGPIWPDPGGLDFGQELFAIAAVAAVLLVLIPILFFGLELIIVGVLLTAGVVARTLLGQPWGWRTSQRLIAEVAAQLEAGSSLVRCDPHGSSPPLRAPSRSARGS